MVCRAAAFGLYAFLGFLMDGPASMATGMIGLQIAPQCATHFALDSLSGQPWDRAKGVTLNVLAS